MNSSNPRRIDDSTMAVFLDMPPARVVLLQSCFETYEGLGTVRTLGQDRPTVCVLTSPDSLQDCLSALDSLQNETGWRMLSDEESARLDTDKFLNGESV